MNFEDLHKTNSPDAHLCGDTWRPYSWIICSTCRGPRKPIRKSTLLLPEDAEFKLDSK